MRRKQQDVRVALRQDYYDFSDLNIDDQLHVQVGFTGLNRGLFKYRASLNDCDILHRLVLDEDRPTLFDISIKITADIQCCPLCMGCRKTVKGAVNSSWNSKNPALKLMFNNGPSLIMGRSLQALM